MRSILFFICLVSLLPYTKSFSSPPTQKHKVPSTVKIPSKISVAESTSETFVLKRELSTVDLAIAGAIAAIVGDASLHPIDCIKTVQQSNIGYGTNMIVASKYIFNTFGLWGFYYGLAPYLVGDSIGSAVKFASYEYLKNWATKNIDSKYIGNSLFICAALSFLVASIILVPGELIKQRLQMGQIDSFVEGITSIYESDGFLGFYKGFSGVCLRDVPYTMIELGVYDNLKQFISFMKNKDNEEGNDLKTVTQLDEIYAAAITGGVAGYFTTPFDTIKTKLMTDENMLYSGFVDCFMKTVNEYGLESVFQGGIARVIWLVPFTAIYLPCYDLIKRQLETIGVKKS